MSRREIWLTVYWILVFPLSPSFFFYFFFNKIKLHWNKRWCLSMNKLAVKSHETMVGSDSQLLQWMEYLKEFHGNSFWDLCFSIHLGRSCPQMLFRTESTVEICRTSLLGVAGRQNSRWNTVYISIKWGKKIITHLNLHVHEYELATMTQG